MNLWIKSCVGCEASDLPSHSELCTRALEYGQTYVVADTDRLSSGPIFQIKGNVVIYFAASPITIHGEIIGLVFTVDYCARSPDITDRQRATLESVAKITAQNIELRMGVSDRYDCRTWILMSTGRTVPGIAVGSRHHPIGG